MSTIGPKGPSDASASAKVLQFRRPTETATRAALSPATPTVATEVTDPTRSAGAAAVFDSQAGQSVPFSAPVEGAALSQLVARLKARGDQGAVASAVTSRFLSSLVYRHTRDICGAVVMISIPRSSER